ncbi:ABC transporter ATP-binding protein [Leptolyngbya sp. FACHB-261]|uniref:ABC transporter ATP-binding protein n=1 Tax=Leptolyngbya sp. FACHB-261 TaxID=2692806 RepID=UPI001681FB81|nr:ABC transporter ATP-binding protein [Leptolyngbya sp. FACHB-261]MBD2099821.1 ABC transporter ATP-binding protein [Leptolyngbya sp. FACHB-261]
MAGLRDVVNYYRPYWRRVVFSVTASSVLEVVDLISPYAMGQVLNVLSRQPVDPLVQGLVNVTAELTGLPVSPQLSLGVLLSVICLLTVGRAPIQPWLGHWFHWDVVHRARRDQYAKAHEKLFALTIDFYDENNAGGLSSRIAKGISNHTNVYPQMMGNFVPRCLRVLGSFFVILALEWRIALAFGCFFSVILWLNHRKLRQITQDTRHLDHYMEQTISHTAELITNMKTVKAFASEARELKRQKTRLEREFKVDNYKLHRSYTTLNMLRTSLVQCATFAVLFFTSMATVQGSITLGHFVTIWMLSNMAFSEVRPLGDYGEWFARHYISMARFHEFMENPEGLDANALKPQDSQPYQFTGKLEFCNLGFGYHADRPVLKELNLLIQPCQTVALVGRSGSGKSTLVKLLFRYFDPTKGQLLIDGQDIRELDVSRYRQRLAIVHQDVDIFNGTLLENLTYGRPNATLAEVKQACHIACMDEVVANLSNGYQTVVGERGVRLSGGQRQRLGIARALICDPDVLVFDEATSSLDYESERAIQVAMQGIQGTRTTIIIAHRLSTVRDADLIVVLDQGQIVETGNHRELLRQGGIYHRLHALQESGELLT